MLEACPKCLATLRRVSVAKSEALGSGLGAVWAWASMQGGAWVALPFHWRSPGTFSQESLFGRCSVSCSAGCWGGHLSVKEVTGWWCSVFQVSNTPQGHPFPAHLPGTSHLM